MFSDTSFGKVSPPTARQHRNLESKRLNDDDDKRVKPKPSLPCATMICISNYECTGDRSRRRVPSHPFLQPIQVDLQ